MSSDRIYLDNAATSFPKPEAVHKAMLAYATTIGASPGRGAYAESRQAAQALWECRALICELIGGENPDQVVFTLNTTDALNLAIKGIASHRLLAQQLDQPLQPTPSSGHRTGHKTGPKTIHMITTAMDHNSVLRPLNALAGSAAIEWTCVPVDPSTGLVEPNTIAQAIRPETALVAVVHASNVSGTVQPIEQIGRICKHAGVPLLVDAAQSVGHIPVDVQSMGIDLLAFPGHKGLMGPLGTGGLYLRPGMEALVTPLREGGTGSRSELDIHPVEMPDRYEAGSHNTLGLIGLAAGVQWILEQGIAAIADHERALIELMLEHLPGAEDGYRLLGPQTPEHRCGVFSLVHESIPAGDIADRLESGFGVLTRAGLHCAPRAHTTFGSNLTGAVRLSIGAFTTREQVLHACEGLRTAVAVGV